MSIKLKDTIYDFISNSDKLDGYNASDFSLVHDHNYISSTTKQSPNKVLAGPSSGSTTSAPSFRSLVAADIPNLSISKITNLQSTLDGKSGTEHNHDSAYLKLAGGTLTGKLGITDSNNGASITLNNISGTSGNPCYIYYKVSGATKASTGYFSNFAYLCNEVATGYPRIGISDTGNPEYWDAASDANKYTLLHTGNWSSYCAPASHSHSYLPLSGGTVTGDITVSKSNPYVRFTHSGTAKGYVGYYSGNSYIELYNSVGKNGVFVKDNSLIQMLCSNLHIGPNILTDDTEIISARYIRCVGKSGSSYINWGYSDTAGNIGELAFNYSSAASTSNSVYIGFHSKVCIQCYYSGVVNIPGTLQIGGESITFVT